MPASHTTAIAAAAAAVAVGAVLFYAKKRRDSTAPAVAYARPNAPEGRKYKYRAVHGIPYPPSVLQNKVDECRRRFIPRDDDIFVTTYPKCGTTVMQQIVLLLQRGGNPEGIDLGMTGKDTPWIEQVASGRDPTRDLDWLDTLPARRVFKTHAPRHLFPCVEGRGGAVCAPAGARLIVVSRNPFDATVSMFHHAKDKRVFEYADGEWDDFFALFLAGRVEHGCFFERHAAWWAACKADPARILWLHCALPNGSNARPAASLRWSHARLAVRAQTRRCCRTRTRRSPPSRGTAGWGCCRAARSTRRWWSASSPRRASRP